MTTDFRTLCAELLDEVVARPLILDRELLTRARAALADEPAVPEGREPVAVTGQPSDEELLDLLPQGNESGFWLPKGLPSDWVDGEFIAPPKAIIAFARDVLELWGNAAPQPPAEGEVAEVMGLFRRWAEAYPDSVIVDPCWLTRAADLLEHQAAPAPAAGEVAELVMRLHRASDGASAMGWEQDSWVIARAAELLQRQAPVPVPVSERLPGPGDCDAAGRCWWLHVGMDGVGAWVQRAPYTSVASYAFFRMTHWLPAHALPIPHQQENAND